MCFSIPTPEDPLNEKQNNIDSKKDKKLKTKKVWPSKEVNNSTEENVNGNDASQNKRKANGDHQSNGKNQEQKRARVKKESTRSDKENTKDKMIQDVMQHVEAFESGKPSFF
ncbi:hypothetical protein Hanom_Chr17g01551401 [Helianthus anomalus]